MSYAPPPGPPPGPPPSPNPAPQWGPPPASGPAAYGTPHTDGTAVVALILSIASWVICPMIAAIVALVLAHVAGNKIDASGGRVTGEGLVRAAQIIAWIHIVVTTLVMVGVAIALVANDSSGSSLRALVG
jgi:ABC-type sugar transport system permease subunit